MNVAASLFSSICVGPAIGGTTTRARGAAWMNVAGSLFSGVGGLDLGLARAGWDHAFFCEADPYRRRVLARHWPGVPIYEDVRRVYSEPAGRGSGGGRSGGAGSRTGDEAADVSVDLLAGGFPCQDLSVAGRRRGLAGERSGLFFEFARVADAVLGGGGWLLIENVPGLLSSHGGRDFAVLLASLGELGFHDLAWRVLDSRYFGVPQRRRRVFILARRSRGRRASEVLLEPESGGGDFAAGRKAGPRVAASPSRGSAGAGISAPGRRQEDDHNIVSALDRQRGGADDNSVQAGHLVARALTASERWDGESETFVAHTLRSEGFDASEDGTGRGTPLVADRVRAPSRTAGRMEPAAFNLRGREEGARVETDNLASLRSSAGGKQSITSRCAVDPRPDGPRYAGCGDAVTANVAEWIGRRLLNEQRKGESWQSTE